MRGFAGLTAALRLKQAGLSVAVLEARDRVGGRTFTVPRDDGSWIDKGGAWVGPTQDRIHALMNEFGVKTFKQYTDGDAMMVVDGKQYRYGGTIPWSMSPWASVNLGAAMFELGQMCKSIPLEAPWEAKKAQKWDRMTLAQWLDKNVISKAAHDLLDTAVSGCYTSAASEVSMLFMLYQMGIGRRPRLRAGRQGQVAGRPGGRRHGCDLPADGRRARRRDPALAAGPVASRRTPTGSPWIRRARVRARHVIVAVPLAIASQIIYEPMLPTDRSFLHQRMPSGAIVKISIVYDEPFWRADGLCGQSAAPGSLAPVTIDACTDTGIAGHPVRDQSRARSHGEYERLDEAERRQAVLDALVERFGAKAGKPVEYVEQNWTANAIPAAGCSATRRPVYSPSSAMRMREPCGRIHWAGTESSAKMCGWIDGAIRSGERAASEVMASEAVPALD